MIRSIFAIVCASCLAATAFAQDDAWMDDFGDLFSEDFAVEEVADAPAQEEIADWTDLDADGVEAALSEAADLDATPDDGFDDAFDAGFDAVAEIPEAAPAEPEAPADNFAADGFAGDDFGFDDFGADFEEAAPGLPDPIDFPEEALEPAPEVVEVELPAETETFDESPWTDDDSLWDVEEPAPGPVVEAEPVVDAEPIVEDEPVVEAEAEPVVEAEPEPAVVEEPAPVVPEETPAPVKPAKKRSGKGKGKGQAEPETAPAAIEEPAAEPEPEVKPLRPLSTPRKKPAPAASSDWDAPIYW